MRSLRAKSEILWGEARVAQVIGGKAETEREPAHPPATSHSESDSSTGPTSGQTSALHRAYSFQRLLKAAVVAATLGSVQPRNSSFHAYLPYNAGISHFNTFLPASPAWRAAQITPRRLYCQRIPTTVPGNAIIRAVKPEGKPGVPVRWGSARERSIDGQHQSQYAKARK